jgi:tetratricopeptide (TPR) repeat protein
MGATVLKKANDPAGASKAVDLFTQALTVAPWFADAYYNRAIAREAAGQFEPAMDDLKLYLEFNLSDAERREAQDKIYALKADAQLASARKAEQDKIASAEEAKRQAQQARRDVIRQIKNAVANRNYNSSFLSYDKNSPFAGMNQYELFGGGQYWMHGSYDYYIYFWKFFDERVEVWAPGNGIPACQVSGESRGPKITDMRWFNSCSDTQWWGYFDLNNGYLYTGVAGGNNRPINDSQFDPNKRYSYTRYAPPR